MNEKASYPLVVRWPNKTVEIPERLHTIDSVKNLLNKTHWRFSAQSYTLQEVQALLGASEVIDATHIPYLDLIESIRRQHTILIQLLSHKRWKILCLLDMVEKWWSALEQKPEWQVGIFHTGSHLSLGCIPAQYLMQDNKNVSISALVEIQKIQPDIIAWRNSNF